MDNNLRSVFRNIDILLPVDKSTGSIPQILAIMTALTMLSAISGFIHFPYEQTIYYCCLFVNSLYLLSNFKRIIYPFVLLYLILILNVTIIDIPPFFKPFQRVGLFILMTITATSAFESKSSVEFRSHLFRYTIFGLIFLTIGSFFCFFLGVNLMSRRNLMMANYEMYSSQGGWFGGLTVHSMILGPISMIVALFFFVLYMDNRKKLYLVLFFMATMSAVFASSRAALLGLVVAIVYSLFFGKFSHSMKKHIVGLLVICSLLTLPISDIAFRGVINKQQNREMQSDNINSRQDKFDYRIAEFKKSPLLGVGFCSIDIEGGDGYSPYDGRIEPGTSHLSVLSMTGILGMMAYLIILYRAYTHARKADNAHSRFVLLCFIAFFVHAWFEGYVFSAGGFLSFLYWLIIGQCIDSSSRITQLSHK